MKVKSGDFYLAVQRAQRARARHPIRAEYGDLDVEFDGAALSVTGFDGNLYIQSTVDADATEDGEKWSSLAHFESLWAFAQYAQEDIVSTIERGVLTLRSGESEIEVPIAEGFFPIPTVEAPVGRFVVDKTMLSALGISFGVDEIQLQSNVNVTTLDENVAVLFASDGTRSTIILTDTGLEGWSVGDLQVLVPPGYAGSALAVSGQDAIVLSVHGTERPKCVYDATDLYVVFGTAGKSASVEGIMKYLDTDTFAWRFTPKENVSDYLGHVRRLDDLAAIQVSLVGDVLQLKSVTNPYGAERTVPFASLPIPVGREGRTEDIPFEQEVMFQVKYLHDAAKNMAEGATWDLMPHPAGKGFLWLRVWSENTYFNIMPVTVRTRRTTEEDQ